MEDPYPIENIDRSGDLMLQTSDNSQLLRRVLWISAELTIISSLKHKNTQPLYIFNKVRFLHLDRLKEGTWLHSFEKCDTQLFSGCPPGKIWVDLQGRIYRVPFKSIFRVQNKQAINSKQIHRWLYQMSGWQAGHSRNDGNHYTSTIQYNGTTLLFGHGLRTHDG